MSEGEFKKRIVHRMRDEKQFQDKLDQYDSNYGAFNAYEKVLTWLEEAKKEFQEVEKGKTDDEGEYICTYHEWFKKWFGGE